MADPLTINFGPWSPDLQNVPVDVLNTPMPLTVPTADCLNVYYQDGQYRCLPGLNPFGPALGAQALQAFNWYDNTDAVEILFAATANGIQELIDGVWSPVGVENVIVVQPASWATLRTTFTGLVSVAPMKAATTWKGAGLTVSGGSIYNGTLKAGVSSDGNSTGFKIATFGTMTPASDQQGHPFGALLNQFLPGPGNNRTILTINALLPQNYFSTLNVTQISLTLASSAASYSQSGGTTTWLWAGSLGVGLGNSYTVIIKG